MIKYVTSALILICVVGGCGGPKWIKTDLVEGKVTLNGEPVADATVGFTPTTPGGGAPAYARTDAAGTYKLQTPEGKPEAGTIPGEYVVMVSKVVPVPTGKMIKASDGKMVEVTVPKSMIPELYGKKDKTPFKVQVVPGKNRFDFELTPDGT